MRSRRRGTVDERRATEALDDLAELDLVRYPHVPFLKRVWELRDNVSPSDAIYVGLAEALDATWSPPMPHWPARRDPLRSSSSSSARPPM